MKINKLCILFVSLCSFAYPNMVEPLSDETAQEISTLNKSFPTQLEDAEETPILSNPSKLEIIIKHKSTSDFPRSVRTILFSKAPKDGKITVALSSSGHADRLHDQIKNRRSGTIFFKNVKNQTDNFCVEFVFSKKHSLTLAVTIHHPGETCPREVLTFVKSYTEHRQTTGEKLLKISFLGAIGLFFFTNNPYKRAIKSSYCRVHKQFMRKNSSDTNQPLQERMQAFFEKKGSKKELLTVKDIWGTYDLSTIEDLTTKGRRWVSGNLREAILIITTSEYASCAKLMQFLCDNRNVSHTETRSAASMSTGTGYGSDLITGYGSALITGYGSADIRRTSQSIKTGNRILFINDNATECHELFKDKSSIKWEEGSEGLYGKIDSRLCSEIEDYLVSEIPCETFQNINKFFDLGASLT